MYPFFVYGTLLTGECNHRRFGDSITAVEPATVTGSLHDLGFCPMMVNGTGIVRGELIQVREGAYNEVLEGLDILEGYSPKRPEASLYTRQLTDVTTQDGRHVRAWVYLGQDHRCTLWNKIPSGSWKDR